MRNSGSAAPDTELAVACERALVFVRRHGRDHGYLRWVLRSVGV